MPTPNVPRLPRARTLRPEAPPAPEWARIAEKFYADSFDARDADAFVESCEAFAELTPPERAFHQAHLAFRQVQALADLHATLKAIEVGVTRLDPKALASLKHLSGIRKALLSISRGQQDVLDALEGGESGAHGEAREADDDDEDDEDADDDDREGGSDLADAVDADEPAGDVEEEDHGNGDGPALIPEVFPAGSRRPVELTAEDVLDSRARGES
jgi:hypothetical protein